MIEDNDDDDGAEDMDLRIYRVAYSHDRDGWCVWEETKDHRLIYNCGPFGNERAAREMMRDMNVAQGMEWYAVEE